LLSHQFKINPRLQLEILYFMKHFRVALCFDAALDNGIGHFFGAMQIDGFIEKTNSKSRSMNGSASFATPNPLPAAAAR